MKSLVDIIYEKLIINSKTKIKNYEKDIKKWDKIIEKWIKEWTKLDFEYLIELMDKFLETNEFGDVLDYEDFYKFRNDKQFKIYLSKKFIEFKKDLEEQNKIFKK